MKLKITRLFISDKDKQGVPLKTKDGRPYTKVAIKSQEFADRWLSGFSGDWNRNWKEGDIVDVKVDEKVMPDGNIYLNFSKIDPIDELSGRVAVLEIEVKALKNQLNYPQGVQEEDENGSHVEDEIKGEDLPF